MSDTLDTPWQPLPKVCCCRNKNKPLANGLIYTNAGCKLHGLTTSILSNHRAGSRDVTVPVGQVRAGSSGMFHRIAD